MKYISVSDEKEKYQKVVNEEPYKEIKAETARLVLWLEEDHRESEIIKAAKDKSYREKLYQEYQIF